MFGESSKNEEQRQLAAASKSAFVMEDGWLGVPNIMERFIRDHNRIHGIDSERFLELEGRERFLTYLSPIMSKGENPHCLGRVVQVLGKHNCGTVPKKCRWTSPETLSFCNCDLCGSTVDTQLQKRRPSVRIIAGRLRLAPARSVIMNDGFASRPFTITACHETA